MPKAQKWDFFPELYCIFINRGKCPMVEKIPFPPPSPQKKELKMPGWQYWVQRNHFSRFSLLVLVLTLLFSVFAGVQNGRDKGQEGEIVMSAKKMRETWSLKENRTTKKKDCDDQDITKTIFLTRSDNFNSHKVIFIWPPSVSGPGKWTMKRVYLYFFLIEVLVEDVCVRSTYTII